MSKKKLTGDFKDNLTARSEEAKTVRKIVFIIVIALALIVLIGGISGYMYVKSALEPVDPDSDEEITIDVPIGSSTSSIAAILEENGIIKDGRIFRLYTKFNNESEFQAGEYTFTPAVTFDEIIESLKNGKVMLEAVHTITIPEGLTIDQIAGIFSGKLHFSKEEFLDKASDEEYINELIAAYPDILSETVLDPEIKTPLEGYLFASTYQFYEEEPSIELVIETMLSQTQKVYSAYAEQIEQLGFTPHEALTFASIVERETASEDQRAQISGVFYNRIEEGMPLQTDPTVLYALGEHNETVTYEDLEIDSPYNTYLVEALPIGPISNFAENSLKAVVAPEDSNNLYFLHDGEGNIYFAETFEEHRQNRDKYMN
ncbi:endolytic transglycosylase MltG [Oceanobacillus massiliensis]|uniref:endolytic transglycosylase MltG n=2 Tax=Oceanobacillus massiliensis TaxID=1465765 RepID=UPI000289247B|nr:endolytic transglycosylase MltG [Oceanobacillus massiliensis]